MVMGGLPPTSGGIVGGMKEYLFMLVSGKQQTFGYLSIHPRFDH